MSVRGVKATDLPIDDVSDTLDGVDEAHLDRVRTSNAHGMIAGVVGLPRFANASSVFVKRQLVRPVEENARSRAEQLEQLDQFGYDAAAEEMSHGALGYEVAFRLGVSPFVFAMWWDRAPAEARALARTVSAQAAMSRAEAALSLAPNSKEDAIVQVALAGHLQKVAAALDPATWNTGKARADRVMPIALVIGPGVPNLQHLRGDLTQAPQVIDHQDSSPLVVETTPAPFVWQPRMQPYGQVPAPWEGEVIAADGDQFD